MIKRVIVAVAIGSVLAGCATQSRQAPTPGQYPNQPYGPGYGQAVPTYPPPAQYPAAPGTPAYPPAQQPPTGQVQPGYPTQPPAQTPPATQPQQPPATSVEVQPLGSYDATGAISQSFMRQEAATVLQRLVAALPDSSRARVQGIPLAVIDDPREVNAFAGCDKTGKAFMAVTAPILTLMAASAESRAFDELYGGGKYDAYINQVAQAVQRGQPVQGLQPGTLPLPQALDPRKLTRQRELFDEQLSFVLSHELAHHYRGHTGCANAGTSTGVTAEDVGRLLSNAVPVFNQPMEVESDVQGIRNVLNAGVGQQGTQAWNEEGAMMVLGFFNKLSGVSTEALLLGFLRTHPLPAFRIPIVQGAADQWRRERSSGSSPFPLPFPFPGLGGQ